MRSPKRVEPLFKSDLELAVRELVTGSLDYFEWPASRTEIEQLRLAGGQREAVQRKEAAIRNEAIRLVASLSGQEQTVVALITRGLSTKAIAREMDTGPNNIEEYRLRALAKLSARSTADVVRIGVYAGLDRDG